jgi:hypothetical protein
MYCKICSDYLGYEGDLCEGYACLIFRNYLIKYTIKELNDIIINYEKRKNNIKKIIK